MVYEGIVKKDGIKKVDISNEIIDYVGRSHQLYQTTQRMSQKKQTPFEKKPLERKSVNDEINSLKGTKKIVLDCVSNKVTEIDSKVRSLEEKFHKI